MPLRRRGREVGRSRTERAQADRYDPACSPSTRGRRYRAGLLILHCEFECLREFLMPAERAPGDGLREQLKKGLDRGTPMSGRRKP